MNQQNQHSLPADIERTSMAILTQELERAGTVLPEENAAVIRRVIHATADFEYAKNLFFTAHAVPLGISALCAGAPIITDTNMALSGVSKPALKKLCITAECYMADAEVAAAAMAERTTRAAASMRKAAAIHPGAIFAVGNAPTALYELCGLMENGLRPALIIGVPVGFVNVVDSKEQLRQCCEKWHVPAIIAMGRKGGSTVAAALCNALLYSAAGMLDPAARGWQG